MAAPNRRRKAAAERKEEINSKALRFCPRGGPRRKSQICRQLQTRKLVGDPSIARNAGEKKGGGGGGEVEEERSESALSDPFLKFANSRVNWRNGR